MAAQRNMGGRSPRNVGHQGKMTGQVVGSTVRKVQPQRTPHTPAAPAPRERRRAVRIRPQMPVAPTAVMGFAAVLVLALFFVMAQAQLAVVYEQTVSLRTTLSELQEEEQQLLAQYEQTFDLSKLEEQLTSDGSMGEAGAGQVVYLDLSQADSVVYYESATQGVSGLVRQLEQWMEHLLA